MTIMLALMRKHGFVEKIDAECEFDREQRIVTPGEVAFLLVGATALRNRRIPLYKIGRQYESMNLRGILGKDVSTESLSDTALGRGLDALYGADLKKLFWSIAEDIEKAEGLDSKVFHLDQTKLRTYVENPPECNEDAAKPKIGLDKEGRTDFFLYSASAMTSENKILRYLVPHDGNASDPEMDKEAIEFLIDAVKPKDCTVVTDCKGTNSTLIALMDDAELGFVSKVPESYSSCLRSRIVWEASRGELRISESKKGHAFCDTDAMVEHDGENHDRTRKVRIVAFTSEKMRSDAEESLIRSGMKKAEKLSKELNKARFATKDEAFAAVGKAQCELALDGAALAWSISSEEVLEKRSKRGRRPKDEPPTYRTVWSVKSEPVADREMASVMAELTAFQVLITNLPRTPEGGGSGEHPRGRLSGEGPEAVPRPVQAGACVQPPQGEGRTGAGVRLQAGEGQRHDVRPGAGSSPPERHRRQVLSGQRHLHDIGGHDRPLGAGEDPRDERRDGDRRRRRCGDRDVRCVQTVGLGRRHGPCFDRVGLTPERTAGNRF